LQFKIFEHLEVAFGSLDHHQAAFADTQIPFGEHPKISKIIRLHFRIFEHVAVAFEDHEHHPARFYEHHQARFENNRLACGEHSRDYEHH
jgi:hypothetical protein